MTRDKNATSFTNKQPKLIIATMTCRIKLGSHTYFQVKILPVTSLDIVITSLALFGFVLLYYLFCDVCSDILICLFYILYCVCIFSDGKNYKKDDRL